MIPGVIDGGKFYVWGLFRVIMTQVRVKSICEDRSAHSKQGRCSDYDSVCFIIW